LTQVCDHFKALFVFVVIIKSCDALNRKVIFHLLFQLENHSLVTVNSSLKVKLSAFTDMLDEKVSTAVRIE
jgi:hypothetical protein